MEHTTQHLADLIADIQQRWGYHALYRAAGGPGPQPPRAIPSCFPPLDAAFGGIPRGTITEITGAPTSGMSTFLCKAISQAQRDGDNILYMDLDSTFDPDYATRCGLNIDKLVLARTDTLDQSMEIIRDLLTICQIGIVVIDFTLNGSRKLPDHGLFQRVHARLRRSRCALVFLLSVTHSDQAQATTTISENSALRLVFERQRWLYHGRDIRGCRSTVTIAKNKRLPGSSKVEIDIPFETTMRGDHT